MFMVLCSLPLLLLCHTLEALQSLSKRLPVRMAMIFDSEHDGLHFLHQVEDIKSNLGHRFAPSAQNLRNRLQTVLRINLRVTRFWVLFTHA